MISQYVIPFKNNYRKGFWYTNIKSRLCKYFISKELNLIVLIKLHNFKTQL